MNNLAILIGNGKYSDSEKLCDLPAVENDIKLMIEYYNTYKYNVHIIKNKSKQTILDILNKYYYYDNTEIYYCGHGYNVNGSDIICASDTIRDKIVATGLHVNEILKIIKNKYNGWTRLIFDCCRHFTEYKKKYGNYKHIKGYNIELIFGCGIGGFTAEETNGHFTKGYITYNNINEINNILLEIYKSEMERHEIKARTQKIHIYRG